MLLLHCGSKLLSQPNFAHIILYLPTKNLDILFQDPETHIILTYKAELSLQMLQVLNAFRIRIFSKDGRLIKLEWHDFVRRAAKEIAFCKISIVPSMVMKLLDELAAILEDHLLIMSAHRLGLISLYTNG